ncbi:hypothetical protein Tco_1406650 [Tanacetum coccineum]
MRRNINEEDEREWKRVKGEFETIEEQSEKTPTFVMPPTSWSNGCRSIEEDEVSLVDGVLEGAFGALGDNS